MYKQSTVYGVKCDFISTLINMLEYVKREFLMFIHLLWFREELQCQQCSQLVVTF